MTTYHGTAAKLFLERIAAETLILKEFIGIGDGAGDDDLYTANFPITTDAGVVTDDELLVNVYTDELTPGTWHELEDDGSEFLITGATGLVQIQAAVNVNGERYSIDYFYRSEVGTGQGVTIDFEGNLLDVHYLGDRDPAEIKAGVIAISGTINQLWCDRDLMGKFLGKADYTELPTDFSLYLYPSGSSAVGQPYVKVSKVKFGGGSISVDVAGILATNMNYKGTVIAVGTV